MMGGTQKDNDELILNIIDRCEVLKDVLSSTDTIQLIWLFERLNKLYNHELDIGFRVCEEHKRLETETIAKMGKILNKYEGDK